MPSSYSPNLKIELIAVGEQTDAWGITTNDNFENVFEEAITGMATATFPLDNDYDWAAGYVNSVGSQAQRNLVIEVTGTISATRNFIVPSIEKQYLVHNNTIGGHDIVVKTLAGTGITVPNGQRAHLFVNGTDVIAAVNYFPALRAGAATLDTALPVASGGSGQTTAQAAMNVFAGAVTSGSYLRGDGTNVVMSAIQAADVPTLNQNTTGSAAALSGGAANRIPYNTGAATTSFITAPTIASTYLEWDGTNFIWSAVASGGVTTFSAGTTGLTPNSATSGAVTLAGTLNIANGGTGQVTAQAAMNTFAGAVTSGQYLRGNGTNVVMSAIQAADVPTLNQNTTGTASNVTGTVAVANGGTGVTTSTGTGSVVLNTGPTLSGPTINDGFTEEVYAIPGGPGGTIPALSPTNGSIQTWVLGGNSTPTAGTWNSGQSMTLMIDDGAAYTVTWTSVPVTWLTNGGFPPSLATTGYTAIVLWKVGSTIYGARVGDNP